MNRTFTQSVVESAALARSKGRGLSVNDNDESGRAADVEAGVSS